MYRVAMLPELLAEWGNRFLRTLERIEQQADAEQRKAARNALEKVQSLAPRIVRLKSGDDAS
jgi:hypothetical protein